MMNIVLPLLASLCLVSNASAQDEITFTSESYPPFSYVDEDGVNRGAGVEQIAAIMDGIAAYRMKIIPWARAIALAETTPMHCAFAAARTPERSEEQTSELQSLMRISYAVFCLKKKQT